MIGKDVSLLDGFKQVLTFAKQPFYFAASKGNTELVKKIDSVLTDISRFDPTLSIRLHQKYFASYNPKVLSLTSHETQYLDNAPKIRAAILNNKQPLQSYDEKTNTYKGITIDILKKLSENSGLEFELINTDTPEDAAELLAQGQADIIVGIPQHFTSAQKLNVLLTSPIFTSPIVRIGNKTNASKFDDTLVSTSIKMFEGQQNIKYISEISDIIRLIDNGDYATAYTNGYMAQYYTEQHYFPNITITPTPYSNYELCIGVSRGCDLRLISILDQAISTLTQDDITDMVFNNAVAANQLNILGLIQRNPTTFILPIVLISFIIIALLLLLFFKTKRLNKFIIKEKNRYMDISRFDQLTNTYNNETFKQFSRDYLSNLPPKAFGALLICDIDNFKHVNDTYGHLFGDEILSKIGDILKDSFRKEDIVGRIGGDEFAVLMKNIDGKDIVIKRCEQLLKRCEELTIQCGIGMSIGSVIFREFIPFDELFIKADKSLYDVKHRGKNGFEVTDINS